jgi:hypothetical protein
MANRLKNSAYFWAEYSKLGSMKLSNANVLVYQQGRKSQRTVKRYYTQWRLSHNPHQPLQCDNPICYFHSNPCFWNGQELKLILDHINGVCGDNRPKNLRFLCPNCDSQQSTKGGGNKGKTSQTRSSFWVEKSGKKAHVFFPETGKFTLQGEELGITVTSAEEDVTSNKYVEY